MPQPVKKDIAAFRKTYKLTRTLRTSALAAGYSQNTANMGLEGLPKNIQNWVRNKERKLEKLELLGANTTAQQQENAVRGAILSNIAEGKDKAVGSIKLGGQDRRVNMFTPESMTGIIVIDSPRELPQLPQLQADTSSVSNSTE